MLVILHGLGLDVAMSPFLDCRRSMGFSQDRMFTTATDSLGEKSKEDKEQVYGTGQNISTKCCGQYLKVGLGFIYRCFCFCFFLFVSYLLDFIGCMG